MSETRIIHDKTQSGFIRIDEDHMGVPSYDESTRTFALTPDHDYFEFYAGGAKFTKASAESIIWDNVSGAYYFYFDTNGDLQKILNSNMTEEIFLTSAICGLVYWNATTGKAIVQASDEQHGVVNQGGMDSSSHFRLHMCDGAKWSKGGDITGLADASDSYTSIDAVLSFDEDILHVTPPSTTHPFIWKEGANGDWVESTTPDNKVGYIASGDTYISWNEWTGTTWQLSESSYTTDYIIHYIIWTNDVNHPIKKLVGQQAYSSRSSARDGLDKEIGDIKLAGFPSTEAHVMYAYIVKRNGDLEDDGDGHAYIDMRGKTNFSA